MNGDPHPKCLFVKMPNELLHPIYEGCSVNAKLCVKMCSKHFRDATPGTVRDLYRDISRTIDFGSAKFDRLCLDDIYTGLKAHRHVCSACQCLHRAEEFTKSQLQADPTTRVCEASQRTLDLTPGNSFTYQQLLNSRDADLPLAPPYTEDFTFRPMDDQSGQWTIVMDWGLGRDQLYLYWTDDVKDTLENFPVCVCPHLTSSDPQVLRAINSYCQDSDASLTFATCSMCNTKVEVSFPDRSSTDNYYDWTAAPVVSLHVERKIGKLGVSAVDPRWKAQSLPAPQQWRKNSLVG